MKPSTPNPSFKEGNLNRGCAPMTHPFTKAQNKKAVTLVELLLACAIAIVGVTVILTLAADVLNAGVGGHHAAQCGDRAGARGAPSAAK